MARSYTLDRLRAENEARRIKASEPDANPAKLATEWRNAALLQTIGSDFRDPGGEVSREGKILQHALQSNRMPDMQTFALVEQAIRAAEVN